MITGLLSPDVSKAISDWYEPHRRRAAQVFDNAVNKDSTQAQAKSALRIFLALLREMPEDISVSGLQMREFNDCYLWHIGMIMNADTCLRKGDYLGAAQRYYYYVFEYPFLQPHVRNTMISHLEKYKNELI